MSPAARPADSAGTPWAGRTLAAQPFPGDDGSVDPVLRAALAEGDLERIVAAWAPTRVLVPIVAVLGEGDETSAAHVDSGAEMALITLTRPDGVRALPLFTCLTSLAAWHVGARPVPVEAARAAQAAVAEECDVVVLDPAGPVTRVLPRPAVWAVAQGRSWVPPARDPGVVAAVAAIVEAVALPGGHAHRCEPAGDAGLRVVLGLPPGLTADRVRALTTRLTAALADDPVITERVEAVAVAVRSL